MFESALVESAGRVRARRGWISGVAALINGGALIALLLLPLLHPLSLPRHTLGMLLTAPRPPAAHMPSAPQPARVPRSIASVNPFQAPTRIPSTVSRQPEQAQPADLPIGSLDQRSSGSLSGIADAIGSAPPPQVHVARPQHVPISSGVMAGNKVSGVEPQYPPIARAARVEGIVTLEATIARTGAIENLRVIGGPPLLTAAAVDAVRTWRYRPYLLNGEPVEVETTVRVVFRLGQ